RSLPSRRVSQRLRLVVSASLTIWTYQWQPSASRFSYKMAVPSSLPPEFDRGVVTTVHQGDCLVSNDTDLTFSTVLGSCISACVRDRVANVGGMNHFLLAEQSGSARDRYGASARYGAFAMEQL